MNEELFMVAIYARTSREQGNEKESTIEQQIEAGIKWATFHDEEYKVYQDKGISGYKLGKDDSDPYTNRPGMVALIKDIKDGLIQKVYCWEHSRLSRNVYSSAAIFNIFEKYNIELYEKDKKFSYDDPTNKFLRQIMDSVAEYERNLIVGRTTRGLYNAIDTGRRSHCRFYGYKPNGRNAEGYKVFVPEPAELEKIKYAYKRFLQGASLRAISLEFFQNAKSTDDAQTFLKRASKLGRFLRHYEYTGKVLNMEGLEILHKFENNEIPDLHELLEDKYWVNHQFYTEKVISLKDWIKVREKLQENKRIKADGKMRASRFSLGTGLLECPVCKEKYFYHVAKISNKEYFSYYHKKLLNLTFCSNIKNIAQRKLDNILKHFYFYFNLYFDNSKQVYETAREQARLQKIELESEDKKIKKQISLIKNQINKLNKALDTTDEVEEIKILAKQIAKKEDELLKLNNDEISNKILLDEVIEKYKVNDYKSSMTSLKDRILEFFFSYDDRRRHDELQHYKYYLYDKAVVILANTTLFVYSRKSEYIFDESLLDMVKNDFDNFMKVSSPFGYGSPLFFGDTIYFNSYVNSIFNFDTELLKNYKYNSGVITYKDSKGNTKTMFFKDE